MSNVFTGNISDLVTEEEYQASKPTIGKELKKGIGRGIDLLQANAYGALAAHADAAKANTVRDWAEQGQQSNMQEAAQNPAAEPSFTNLGKAYTDGGVANGIGRTALWAAGAVGELAPQGAAAMASGAIGNRLGGGAGGAGLMMANNVAQETGSIYGDILEKTGKRDGATAIEYGVPAALVDTAAELIPVNKILGKGIGQGSVLKDVTKAGVKQILTEAPTEAVQTGIERAAVTSVDPNQQTFTPEGIKEIVDSAAAGGIGGAVSGAGAEGIGRGLQAISPQDQTQVNQKEEVLLVAPQAVNPSPQIQTDPIARHVDNQVQAAASVDPSGGPLSKAVSTGVETGAVAIEAVKQAASDPAIQAKNLREIQNEIQANQEAQQAIETGQALLDAKEQLPAGDRAEGPATQAAVSSNESSNAFGLSPADQKSVLSREAKKLARVRAAYSDPATLAMAQNAKTETARLSDQENKDAELNKVRAKVDGRLNLPEFQDQLVRMADNAGWEEVGGRVIMHDLEGNGRMTAVGRTPWAPKEEWFTGGLGNKEQIQTAVRKAINGEKLGNKQRQIVEYMLDFAGSNIITTAQRNYEYDNFFAKHDINGPGNMTEAEMDEFFSSPEFTQPMSILSSVGLPEEGKALNPEQEALVEFAQDHAGDPDVADAIAVFASSASQLSGMDGSPDTISKAFEAIAGGNSERQQQNQSISTTAQGESTGGTGGGVEGGQEAQGAGILQSYTNEEIAAKEKAAADAASKAAQDAAKAEQKARADAERGDFQLTGSDRPADVAAAAGKNDIFGVGSASRKPEVRADLFQLDPSKNRDIVEKWKPIRDEIAGLVARYHALGGVHSKDSKARIPVQRKAETLLDGLTGAIEQGKDMAEMPEFDAAVKFVSNLRSAVEKAEETKAKSDALKPELERRAAEKHERMKKEGSFAKDITIEDALKNMDSIGVSYARELGIDFEKAIVDDINAVHAFMRSNDVYDHTEKHRIQPRSEAHKTLEGMTSETDWTIYFSDLAKIKSQDGRTNMAQSMGRVADFERNRLGSERGWDAFNKARSENPEGKFSKKNVFADSKAKRALETIKGVLGQDKATAPISQNTKDRPMSKQRLIASGEQLYSATGRKIALAPKIDTSSKLKLSGSMKRMNQWLYDEAMKEAVETGSDWNQTLIKGIQVKNLSQSDKDTLNQILFGDADGVSDKNRISGNGQQVDLRGKSILKEIAPAKKENDFSPTHRWEDRGAESSENMMAKKERPKKAVAALSAIKGILGEDGVAEDKPGYGKESGLTDEQRAQLGQASIQLAEFYLESGLVKFSDFARQMLHDVGTDKIKPFIEAAYMGGRANLRQTDKALYGKTDKPETVEALVDSGLLDDLKGRDVIGDQDENIDNNDDEQILNGEVGANAGNESKPAEPDGRNANEVGQSEGDLQPGGRGTGRSGASGSGRKTNRDKEVSTGQRIPDYGSSADGERGDQRNDPQGASSERAVTGGSNNWGGRPVSTGGLFDERTPDGAIDSSLEKAASVEGQKAKPGIGAKSGDAAQIKEQMPFLTDGQVEDVIFAEKRFAKEKGRGVLFTNGTGTGKTFTGLAIVKRMVRKGKGNILIAVPKQTIADAWVKAGASYFGLDIKVLEDTNDNGGKGIVVTTFANLGDNSSLVERDWDGFVMDEAHYLSSSADGKRTKASVSLNALNLFDAGDRIRIKMADELKLAIKLMQEAKDDINSDWDVRWAESDGKRKKAEEIFRRFEAAVDAEKERIAKIPMADRPRTTFLSATPFAYEKNIRWAQGYLFDWSEGQGDDNRSGYGTERGYNGGENYERFMMTHFGYRMRYNKLTEPDAKVDRTLMQRQFNKHLKQQGVLSGRMLDSDFDYDRLFVSVDSAIGRRVDDALRWLSDNQSAGSDASESAKQLADGVRLLSDQINKDNFGHLQRRYFLEAIKAREMVQTIKDHISLGRKVLVIHDFKQGGVSNPFRVNADEFNEPNIKDAIARFEGEFPDLISDFDYIPSPITTLKKAFPGALVYNGDVSAKNRIAMQNQFNSDDDDSPKLMIAQGDAMREGVSIHDTTGKFQRATIQLGLPTKPTASIQQEGRTYRTGQASNAMFRYVTIGTGWEMTAFAQTIAGRASATENLAMGELARGLKDAFINGYEEADLYPPGFDGEGTGGKAKDRALAEVLTDWDAAISYYFGSKKQGSGRNSRGREHSEYFATPEPVGLKMVEWLGLRAGDSALEPSAGHGAIAQWLPENTVNRAIEPTFELSSRLGLRFDGDIVTDNFEDHHIANKYDGIVMNPPFGTGGKLAIEHLEKAAGHLRDGGRIVALIPRGGAADKRFDSWFYGKDEKGKPNNPDLFLVREILLPSVTFERAGTSVSTRIVVIEKAAQKEQADSIKSLSALDLSSISNIKDLFDRIQNVDMPERVKPLAEDAQDQNKTADEKVYAQLSGNLPEFVTATTFHAKQKYDLFVATIKSRVEREQYNIINNIAKRNGGWYSAFKGSGAIPGFQFKSEESRQKFLDEVNNAFSDDAGQENQSIVSERKKQADLFRKPPGKTKGRLGEDVQADLFDDSAPKEAAPEQARENFFVRYQSVPVGQLRVGIKTITGPEDAAHAVSSIRKHAQETMMAIVVNKGGDILSVIRHSKGIKDASNVSPIELVAAAVNVPDAAGVWLAHNHPSGMVDPSNSDEMITKKIVSVAEGTGVQVLGHVIVGHGNDASAFDATDTKNQYKFKIKPMVRRHSVDVTERVIRKALPAVKDRVSIDSPATARSLVGMIEPKNAVILLNTQHHHVGTVAMTQGEMARLRDGVQVDRLMKAIDTTNAASIIIKAENESGILNTGNFFDNAMVRVLDAFVVDKNNKVVKEFSGEVPTNGIFHRMNSDGVRETGIDRQEAMKVINEFRAKYKGISNLRFSVFDTKEQAYGKDALKRANLENQKITGGYGNGGMHVILEDIADSDELLATLRHEAWAHYGFDLIPPLRKRSVLSKLSEDIKGNAELNGIYEKIRRQYRKDDGSLPPEHVILEEVVASIAEQYGNRIDSLAMEDGLKSVVRKIIDAIAGLLRSVGMIGPKDGVSEVIDHLVGRARYMRDGGKSIYDNSGIGVELNSMKGDGKWYYSALKEAAADMKQEKGSPEQLDDMFFRRASEGDASAVDVLKTHIQDRLQPSLNTFNWWHKSVGTQFHKAWKDRDYKKVFDKAQNYLNDTSRFAMESADLAPGLLPKVDSFADIMNSTGASRADIEKIADSIYTGTLDDQKVYTNQELSEKFGLNDRQRALYREFRKAINHSLDSMVASEIAKEIKDDPDLHGLVMMAKYRPERALDQVVDVLDARAEELESIVKQMEDGNAPAAEVKPYKIAATEARKTLQSVRDKLERLAKMKNDGYAPLMRFGKYTVTVTNIRGEIEYFGMFEKQSDARAMERSMSEEYGIDAQVSAGVMSQEAYKLYAGMSPDTLELFGSSIGFDKSQSDIFQDYLRMSRNNRSALKRLIRRKGTAGFSKDVTRSLASFITSNARQASSNWHLGEMDETIEQIRLNKKEKGDVIDEAIRLRDYLRNPKDEAAAVRNLLFINYIGGSLASALTNMTQPITMTGPYLAQFGSATKHLLAAQKIGFGSKAEGDLGKAMERATDEGTLAPHEVYQLHSEAIRNLGSNILVRKIITAWGRPFALAEAYNRRLTFAAAYNMAKENPAILKQARAASAYSFAVKAVQETQGIYNKGNRPNWARGSLGATVFTFKQYSISYLEFLQRLPRKQQLQAIGILFLLAGINGLPFGDDLEDLIDTIAQMMGYNLHARSKLRDLAIDALGETAGDFIVNGASSLPGSPIDVQARMSLGNLIPGTGILKRSTTDKTRDVAEAVGPIGGMAMSIGQGIGSLMQGDIGSAAMAAAPNAVKNAALGAKIAMTGEYRDQGGRLVAKDVGAMDGVWKAIGFSPSSIAKESREVSGERQRIALARDVEAKIADRWAEAIVEQDADKLSESKMALADWNEKNPDTPIRITLPQIRQRVKAMGMNRRQRLIKSAPKELRGMFQ